MTTDELVDQTAVILDESILEDDVLCETSVALTDEPCSNPAAYRVTMNCRNGHLGQCNVCDACIKAIVRDGGAYCGPCGDRAIRKIIACRSL